MRDIIQRLRDPRFCGQELMRQEAADEIENVRAALNGVAAFFLGQDDSDALPDCFDGLADHEPVTVTLNARTIRAVLKARDDICV